MRSRKPPRFVARTTIATFTVVAFVLSSVNVVVMLGLREYVRESVLGKLEAGQRMLSALEQRRARELGAQVATLAETRRSKRPLTPIDPN